MREGPKWENRSNNRSINESAHIQRFEQEILNQVFTAWNNYKNDMLDEEPRKPMF